ncbi:amidohydrolase family protein [Corynebacterium heidelbergense]|uniref:Amidohydrolase n=1 Tax=Corynebacterium heidelbergense TaxID=2055947 RepID=A0A364V3I5_9CORY|nr:amidohydrolase family protein [Corynebacterium heidelbergense]RAV31205.1 amidohydrolase [Corynebacterium heidelbergense]
MTERNLHRGDGRLAGGGRANGDGRANGGGPAFFIDSPTVVAVDEQHGTTPFTTSLRITGGQIAEMGTDLRPLPGETVISGKNRLVTPGQVNAHTHNWEAFWRGTQDNLPLELWMLMCYPLLGTEPLAPEMVRLRALLLATESLKSGVTTVVDDAYELPSQRLDHLAAEFAAYSEAGIRANVSGQISDIPFLDTMPFARDYLAPEVQQLADDCSVLSSSDYLQFAQEAIASFDRSGEDERLRFMLGPSAPQRCTAELLIGCGELAAEHDLEFHTHVLETRTQRVHADRDFNGSFIEWFEQLGILSPRLTLAHGVWLRPAELELLSEYGCSIAHNPLSNMKLGSGLLPWSQVRRSGINLALGTDGVCSSDTHRLSEVMKSAALVHKITSDDPEEWPTAGEVIEAATLGGARSARLGHKVGSLEPGKSADLVIYDLDTLAFCPRQDVSKQLVYSENGSSIRQVMVAGRMVVEDGETVLVDEAELRRDIAEITPWLHRWQAEAQRANEVFLEGFWKQYRHAIRRWSGSM